MFNLPEGFELDSQFDLRTSFNCNIFLDVLNNVEQTCSFWHDKINTIRVRLLLGCPRKIVKWLVIKWVV